MTVVIMLRSKVAVGLSAWFVERSLVLLPKQEEQRRPAAVKVLATARRCWAVVSAYWRA